jgi:hypothetical protein
MQAIPVNKPFELAPGIPGARLPPPARWSLLLSDGDGCAWFLAHWQRRMIESGLSRDQPALARTVYDLSDLRLVVLNAIWSADEFEAATLFDPAKHEPPRIRHYARPHLDLAVAHRLRDTLESLLPVLPSTLRGSDDVARVTEKYRRITHPLFASLLTRRGYLAAAHRWGRLRRGIGSTSRTAVRPPRAAPTRVMRDGSGRTEPAATLWRTSDRSGAEHARHRPQLQPRLGELRLRQRPRDDPRAGEQPRTVPSDLGAAQRDRELPVPVRVHQPTGPA